jgi:dihydroneopterin aldolase
MLDQIKLEKLRIMGVVGQLEQERLKPQPLEFHITLYLDLSKACQSDHLSDTVDYGAVCELIESIVQSSCDHLLEKLAKRVSDALLQLDLVKEVRVKLKKLRVPVNSDLSSAAVVIHRKRRLIKPSN